jgi:hypothetical protein
MSFKPLPELAGPLYGKDPWPLRFHTHNFGAACFNVLASSVLYNGHQFGTRRRDSDGNLHDKPSAPMPSEIWRGAWMGSHNIFPVKGKTFPAPVELEWRSLDGVAHRLSIDLDQLFKDRLILHTVSIRKPQMSC